VIIESSWKNKVFRKSWDKFYNTIKKAWPPTSNLPHNYHPHLQATRPVTHYQNNIMYASTKSTHAAHDNDNLLIQKSGVSDSKRVLFFRRTKFFSSESSSTSHGGKDLLLLPPSLLYTKVLEKLSPPTPNELLLILNSTKGRRLSRDPKSIFIMKRG